MVALLQKGGVFMYGILGVLIIAFAFFCERVTFLYFRLKLNVDKAFQKIMFLLETMNFRSALDECLKIEKHPLGRILKAGFLKSDKEENKDIERAMEEKILREIPLIKARINYMALFAVISFLLGLLGTSIGLITTLNGFAKLSTEMNMQMVTSKISSSLLTTVFGLMVAIPCLAGYFVLNNRGNYLIGQFKEKSLSLYNILSSLKGST